MTVTANDVYLLQAYVIKHHAHILESWRVTFAKADNFVDWVKQEHPAVWVAWRMSR